MVIDVDKRMLEKMGYRVLLSSEHREEGQVMKILDRGCDGFIQKPFGIEALSQKKREILDKE